MAKKTGKVKNKSSKPEVTKIPEIFDEEGQLKTLKSSDFPKTREGQMAYCAFMVEKWKIKTIAVEKRLDPMAKKKKRREKLLEQLAKLTEELKEETKSVEERGEETTKE